MTDTSLARLNMVESQVRPNGITDHRILDAMMTVKREDFLPATQQAVAYMDEDVALSADGRFLMEPMAFARMVQLAEIKPDDHVLLVGAGTGYGAAVVSHIAADVLALEDNVELFAAARANLGGFQRVSVENGALAKGTGAAKSFDVIIVEGRVAAMPEAILALLKDGGRAVAVVGERAVSKCCVWSSTQGKTSMRSAFDLSIPELPGFAVSQPAFVF